MVSSNAAPFLPNIGHFSPGKLSNTLFAGTCQCVPGHRGFLPMTAKRSAVVQGFGNGQLIKQFGIPTKHFESNAECIFACISFWKLKIPKPTSPVYTSSSLECRDQGPADTLQMFQAQIVLPIMFRIFRFTESEPTYFLSKSFKKSIKWRLWNLVWLI